MYRTSAMPVKNIYQPQQRYKGLILKGAHLSTQGAARQQFPLPEHEIHELKPFPSKEAVPIG